jgi:hypothetical protein
VFGIITSVNAQPEAKQEVIITAEHITVLPPERPLSIPPKDIVGGAAENTTTPKIDNENQRCPRFESAFKEYGLLPVETFSYIAYRESRCRIKAINATWDENGNLTYHLNKDKSWDSGLLQINSSWKTVTRNICGTGLDGLLFLDCNLRVAKYLLDNGGLGHWRL